jgi:hypothetical protein
MNPPRRRLVFSSGCEDKSPYRSDALGETPAHPLMKLMLIGLLWAYLHDLRARSRRLTPDLEYDAPSLLGDDPTDTHYVRSLPRCAQANEHFFS